MKKDIWIAGFVFLLLTTGCINPEDDRIPAAETEQEIAEDDSPATPESIERDENLVIDLKKQITEDGEAIGITETSPNFFEEMGEFGNVDFRYDLNNGCFILSNGFAYYYEDDILDYNDGFILYYNHSINPGAFRLNDDSEHGDKNNAEYSFENAGLYKDIAIQHLIPKEYYRIEDFQSGVNSLTEEAAEYWRKIISNSLKQYRNRDENLILNLKTQIREGGGVETSPNYFEQTGEGGQTEYRCDLNKGAFILWNDWVYSYEEDTLNYQDGCLMQYNHSMNEENFVLSGECQKHNQDNWKFSKEWAMKQKASAIEYLKRDTNFSRYDYDQETHYFTDEAAEYWRKIICNSLKQYQN